MEDFGGSEAELAVAVCDWLRGERRAALEGLLAEGGGLSLKALPYDWSNNASDSLEFALETPGRGARM